MSDWTGVLGGEAGRSAVRSVPLKAGEDPYWHAAARILAEDGRIVEAAIALKDPEGSVRRLGVIEQGLVSGTLSGADEVMDAVRDLVECVDDDHGTAAVKSYLAGWACADVVGRCMP
jgi:CO/xanthine dehydrogenase FAD-binding subunit